MRHHVRLCVAILGVAADLVACAGRAPVAERVAAAPMHGNVGGVMLSGPAASGSTKVIVASFEFTAAGVTARGAVAAFGGSRAPSSQGEDYRLELVDPGSRVLVSYGIGNPRRVIVHGAGVSETGQALYAARFPFHPSASEAHVLDRQGAILARQDVTAAIRALCEKARGDRECASIRR
jgi:hypothetical protein